MTKVLDKLRQGSVKVPCQLGWVGAPMNVDKRHSRTATHVLNRGRPTRRWLQYVALSGLAVMAAIALVGLSGAIVFADLKAPRPSDLADRALQSVPPMQGAEK